jgi:hypothetical protein
MFEEQVDKSIEQVVRREIRIRWSQVSRHGGCKLFIVRREGVSVKALLHVLLLPMVPITRD